MEQHMTGFQSKRKMVQERLESLLESPSRGVKDEIDIARLEHKLRIPLFIFLNAVNGQVQVKISDEYVGSAKTAEELATIFTEHKVDIATDDIFSSSSIDFASEEGFDSDEDAHSLIQGAFDMLA